MDPPQATATIFVCPEFRELANSWVTKEQNLLVEAPDPHGRIPISTPNTYKVAENIHIIKPLPSFLLAKYLGFLPNSWVTNDLQMMSR